MRHTRWLFLCTALAFTIAACGSDSVDSDEQARRAYLGLDMSISKSIALGFGGFNTAQSANITQQMTSGAGNGTLTITGQVDQGNSTNKTMRLAVGMVAYSDGKIAIDDKGNTVTITYDTSTDTTMQPALDLDLKNSPDGTYS